MSNVIPFAEHQKVKLESDSGYSEDQIPCMRTLEFPDGSTYELGDQMDFHSNQDQIHQSLASTRLFQLQMILLDQPEKSQWVNAQLERIIKQIYK
jgi:hypothetical protein